MFKELKKLSENSDSKYSNFRVASIIIFEDGSKVSGVNVESASYGATTCSERNSINFAITKGINLKKAKEIHLLGYNSKISDEENNFFVTPCGICRQVMSEKLNGNLKIIIYNFFTKETKTFLNKDLLPNAFNGENILDK